MHSSLSFITIIGTSYFLTTIIVDYMANRSNDITRTKCEAYKEISVLLAIKLRTTVSISIGLYTKCDITSVLVVVI